MKIRYTKAVLAVAALAAMSSCTKHDLIPEITIVGQAVPTVYWEVGSTVCKAGENFTFQGKYTSEPYRTPLRSEVWYQILRSDVATVTTALAGTSLSYAQTVNVTDTMRAFQCHASFDHSMAEFNGHEYIIRGEVPTSRTLSPLTWLDITEWDQARFDSYYPQGFVAEYLDKVIGYLTDESTANSYYTALQTVYVNYPFTNDQFAAVGLPAVVTTEELDEAAIKKNLWYSTREADDAALVGYYYITIDGEGKTVYNEVPMDYVAPEGVVLYPVYKCAEWLFCRYDDNSGALTTTVRPEWLPKFRTLLEQIPFTAWIYDSANSVYKVDFARSYSLEANFRAYDKDTDKLGDPSAPEHEGITSKTEQKTITLN